jgi:hypothetical protein
MYRVHFRFMGILMTQEYDSVIKMAKFVISLEDQGLSTDISVERL